MPATEASRSATTVRYQRYRAILDCTVDRSSFRIDDVHRGCIDMRPAFVTRVINELAHEGWIVHEDNGNSGSFRWNDQRGEFSATRWLDAKIFGTQIRESPEHQRPREKLLTNGADQLSDAELLAILIRSGRPGESAVDAGETLARVFRGRLKDLPDAGRGELKLVSPAVEKTAYCQIMAGIELGRRIAAVSGNSTVTRIRSASDAMDYCQKQFARLIMDARQEEFHIVTLDTKNQVINSHRITVGTLDASLVHPREVFRPAIKDAAAAIVLTHNHPSGDPTPSSDDLAVTRRLESAGDMIGIDILDHIVLGSDECVSIRQYRD